MYKYQNTKSAICLFRFCRFQPLLSARHPLRELGELVRKPETLIVNKQKKKTEDQGINYTSEKKIQLLEISGIFFVKKSISSI